MKKTRKNFEKKLNTDHHFEEVLELTEHCWAGNDKTKAHQNHAKKLANQGKLGTILKKYDPTGFNLGFNEWTRN